MTHARSYLFDQTPHEIVASRAVRWLLVAVLGEHVVARPSVRLLVRPPDDDFDEARRRQVARASDQLQARRLMVGRDEKELDVMLMVVDFQTADRFGDDLHGTRVQLAEHIGIGFVDADRLIGDAELQADEH